MNRLLAGALAGAAGTAALNVVTYADMALRGRPASEVPAEAARRIAARLGVVLDRNRAEGCGALLGYLDGFAFGIGYALLREPARAVPWPLGGLAVGAATLAPELAAAALGATDPATWGVEGWIASLVPRAAYGLVVAAVCERLGV